MHYTGTVYRTPYWSTFPLLQITQGCTHNKCKFCTMYRDVPFKMQPMEWIEQDLQEIASIAPDARTIQLLSANPLALTYDKLAPILEMINRYLPNVAVITMYARTDNIAHKSDEDLKRLKEAGVNDLYIGVEYGLNDVLADLNKGYSADETREQCLRLNAVGISHCDLMMPGTAGKGRGLETAKATAAIENEIKPRDLLTQAFLGAFSFQRLFLLSASSDGREKYPNGVHFPVLWRS